jgi:hypothetical protein
MSSCLFLIYLSTVSSISVPHLASPYCELMTFGVHLLQRQSITEPYRPESASPYSFLIIFMIFVVLLTRFIIQDSQGLSSLPYSIPPLLFRLHFHDLRRASNLLQHSGLARPYVSSPYSILFVSGSVVEP